MIKSLKLLSKRPFSCFSETLKKGPRKHNYESKSRGFCSRRELLEMWEENKVENFNSSGEAPISRKPVFTLHQKLRLEGIEKISDSFSMGEKTFNFEMGRLPQII